MFTEALGMIQLRRRWSPWRDVAAYRYFSS
jgi:hypothetical protein